MKNHNGKSLSGKSVNRKKLFTHSPIHPFTNRTGITLIELVIGMVLIGIIALVVANVFSTGIKGFFVTDYRKESLDQARLALDRMAKEIRNIKSRTDIQTTTASQLCFKATNILSDDLPATDDIIISYRYDSGTNTIIREDGLASLSSCPGSGGNILAANINPFSFEYLKSNDTTDGTPPNDTKKIRITLTATASGESVQLQTEVLLRNPVTLSSTVSPDPPTGVSGSLSGNCTLNLSWTPDNDPKVPVNHKIYRCVTTIGSASTSGCYSLLTQVTMPSTSYADTLSTSGRRYYYKLTAVDADTNESAFSTEYFYDYTSALAAPTGLAFTALTCTSDISTASLSIDWTAYGGASSYTIYRNIYSEGGTPGTYTSYQSSAPKPFSDTSLMSIQNHSYEVVAISGGCETQPSTAITVDVDPIQFASNAGGSPDICDNNTNKDDCKVNIQQNSGQTLSLTGITVSWSGITWQGGAGTGTIQSISIGGAVKTTTCVCNASNPCTNNTLIPLTATNLNTATSTALTITWCTKNNSVPTYINTKWRYNDPAPDAITAAQGCQIQVYP